MCIAVLLSFINCSFRICSLWKLSSPLIVSFPACPLPHSLHFAFLVLERPGNTEIQHVDDAVVGRQADRVVGRLDVAAKEDRELGRKSRSRRV